MDKNERVERLMNEVDQVLRHIAEGGAGATIGPDGVQLGMPDWEEQTKHQRPSERVRTHGYPLGFAKSQWMLRDRALVRFSRHMDESSPAIRDDAAAAHEAVARALDWERLLGSFNRSGENPFPVASIDRLATNLHAWLASQGFRAVRDDRPEAEEEQPLPELESRLPNIFDSARGMVVLTEDQVEARIEPEDQVQDAEEDEDDEWEDDEDTDEEKECPICSGSGEVGFFVMEQQCGGCADSGVVDSERHEDLTDGAWTPRYSSVGAAHEASDMFHLFSAGEVEIDDLDEFFADGLGGDTVDYLRRDLSSLDLSGLDFTEADFNVVNPSHAILDGADLTTADVSGVMLTGASLKDAVLTGLDLRSCESVGADFSGANLANTNFAGANLGRARFHGADLRGADLRGATLDGASLELAASLDGANLTGAIGLNDEERTACVAKGARLT